MKLSVPFLIFRRSHTCVLLDVASEMRESLEIVGIADFRQRLAAIDGNVYFMTRKPKDVYKQLVKNPKVQIAAFPNEGRGWMRITCKLVEEETPKIRTTFLDKYPNMKEAHPLDDPDYAFMKLVGITAQMGNKVYSVK
jgi:uncharacterized pyridoxamine 5'-phosphate oxidase family protein